MTRPAEKRVCRGCKTKLTYHPDRKLFYAKRPGDVRETAVEFCTGCGIRVTLHSTDPETPPAPASGTDGENDYRDSLRGHARNDK